MTLQVNFRVSEMGEILKLNYNHIWAVSHFMAKSDIRFYLCGMLVDGENLVATDGHAMGICSMEHNDDFKQQYKNGLIIPSYAINSLVRKLGKPVGIKKNREIDLLKINDKFFVLTNNLDAHEYFSAVDGRYPDYKRVDMPKPTIVPKSVVILDSKYLIKFNKVADGIGKVRPVIYFGEDDKKACYVEISENMHCIVMPLRT